MSMPEQKPGRSVQDVETPNEFMYACAKRFGSFTFDLAASKENSKCDRFFFSEEDNSLSLPWNNLGEAQGNLWLNPPYKKIGPWAKKCAEEAALGATIFMLVPASVGSNWYRDYVHPFAYVLALNPRLKFVGHTTSYPKDLILCHFSRNYFTGFDLWNWK